MPRPFVLLDRDGTIVVERNYLSDPAQLELLPGAAEGLRRVAEAGFGLAIVTNQSGVARGYFDLATVERVHARLREMLAAEHVEVEGIYVCPHGPDEGCRCRKPAPGLAEQAARELGFDLRQSWVIGDKPCDIELGRAIGARTILVRTGYGAGHEGELRPDGVADSLGEAAELVVGSKP